MEKLKDWREMLPLAQAIYLHHAAGCCWHIVLDDRNVDDDSVSYCRAFALINVLCRTRDECRALGDLMVRASRTQRKKLADSRRLDTAVGATFGRAVR
jgi:hypothetical protein